MFKSPNRPVAKVSTLFTILRKLKFPESPSESLLIIKFNELSATRMSTMSSLPPALVLAVLFKVNSGVLLSSFVAIVMPPLA